MRHLCINNPSSDLVVALTRLDLNNKLSFLTLFRDSPSVSRKRWPYTAYYGTHSIKTIMSLVVCCTAEQTALLRIGLTLWFHISFQILSAQVDRVDGLRATADS